MRSLLVAPKDRHSITQKRGVIGRYKCTRLKCDEEYIMGVCKDIRGRLKEHLWAPPNL